MEFSFTITESEFRQAWKLDRKASSRSSLKTAAFWILIMLGLLLLYRMIASSNRVAGMSDPRAVVRAVLTQPAAAVEPVEPSTLGSVGPFLVIAGIWFLIVGWLTPMRLRHLYRKDPRMQGEFTVNITREWMATENTAGTSSKAMWNVYDSWSEGKGIIVLRFHSGSYAVLSLAGLAEPQRDGLREILSGVLEKK